MWTSVQLGGKQEETTRRAMIIPKTGVTLNPIPWEFNSSWAQVSALPRPGQGIPAAGRKWMGAGGRGGGGGEGLGFKGLRVEGLGCLGWVFAFAVWRVSDGRGHDFPSSVQRIN